jgi:hypothetical protein
VAVFVVDLETSKAEAGVASLASEVGSLSAEFNALQASMKAAESEMNAIAAMQQKALGQHAAGQGGDAMRDGGFDWKAAQQKALGGHDQNAEAAAGLKKQGEAAAATRKEFADLTATGDKSAEMLGALREQFEGVAQAAAIGVAILVAYAAALWGLAAAAVKLTQEKDALRATLDVFTGGGGDALLGELEDLSAQLPFTADKLNAWGKSLLAAGIKGNALKTSIKAIAAATAIMGESGGQAALGLIKRFAMMAETGQKVTLDRRILSQMAEAGISATALAKALGVPADKLGKMSVNAKDLGDAMQKALIAGGAKPLALLGQTWESISAKLKEGFEDAFEDLGDLVGPFMSELQSLASEFYAGGIAGGTFKDVIKGVLTPAFEVARRTVRALHIGFLELEVAFLKAKIAVHPLSKALEGVGISGGIVNVAMYLIAGVAVILAVVFGVLALAVLIVASPFILLGIAIYGVYRAVSYIIGIIQGAIANFDNLANAATTAGQNIITGLGNALQSGAAWVIAIAGSVATGIIGAITGPLAIRSPSRVMMRIGHHVTQGLAIGIDDGAPDVQAAAGGAAGAAVAGASSAPGRAGAAQGGGKVEVRVEAGAIVIQGAGGNILDLTEEALARLLEMVVSRAGLAPAGA